MTARASLPTPGLTARPPVSILIPAFNAAPTLAESLASVQAQTFGNFEAIVVDDGSRDETAAIAEATRAQDPRFHLLRQANHGRAAALNTALSRARGQWIAFQDADDVWLPEKLERQMALLSADSSANFLFTNFYFWDGCRDLYPALADSKPLPDGDPMPGLILADHYASTTVLVRRDTLAAAGPFDPELRLSQDWDMWLRLGDLGLRARGLRQPLVRYRRWPGSVTADRSRVAEANIRVLEKNLARTRHDKFKPVYRRSLARARAVRELLRAYPLETAAGRDVSGALLRAWRCQPRLKWLRWYVLARWPLPLGSRAARLYFHRQFTHLCRGY
jgi:glycosyltransferase involved in cell wall biosynthesis